MNYYKLNVFLCCSYFVIACISFYSNKTFMPEPFWALIAGILSACSYIQSIWIKSLIEMLKEEMGIK